MRRLTTFLLVLAFLAPAGCQPRVKEMAAPKPNVQKAEKPEQPKTHAQKRLPTDKGLLADTVGSIAHLMLHFADYDVIPTLYDLMRQLPADAKITLVVPQGARVSLLDTLLQHWPGISAHRVDKMVLDEPMTFWIRDDFVVHGNQNIVLPKRFAANGRHPSLEKISQGRQIKQIPSALRFDGGNIVVSEKQVFVGYNLLLQNIGGTFPNPNALTNYLETLFGKEVVVVGGPDTPLPHEHIDMFLTPLPNGQLLLGDPRLATAEVEKKKTDLQQVYAKVYFDERSTPIPQAAKVILFNTTDFVERLQEELTVPSSASDIAMSQDITLAALYIKNRLATTVSQFDGIERDLRKKGFNKIHRIPILINHGLPEGPFITYNNVLLETREHQQRVYLPQYNIEALDKLASAVFRKLGYHVLPVDVQNISFYNGTLRCISQVLRRE